MHTHDFIEEMRQRLEEERMAVLAELSEESRVVDGSYQANFPDYGRSEEENASEMEEYQTLVATTATSKQRLQEIDEALERIHSNTYGITEEGESIPEDRLRANPAATTVVK